MGSSSKEKPTVTKAVAVAALYLQLNAEFVGFSEILVYVGAIAILIVFAILLTRSGDTPNEAVLAPGWFYGIAVSAAVSAAGAGAPLPGMKTRVISAKGFSARRSGEGADDARCRDRGIQAREANVGLQGIAADLVEEGHREALGVPIREAALGLFAQIERHTLLVNGEF